MHNSRLVRYPTIAARLLYSRLWRLRDRIFGTNDKKLQDHLETINDPSILFVCFGNICRSPFAEYYLKQHIDSTIDVNSVGFNDDEGRPSPEHALRAAKTFDIDMSDHRSVQINEKTVRSADVIFVMDYENLFQMKRHHPGVISKTYLLGSLSASDRTDIPDPIDGDVETFLDIYEEIATAIEGLENKTHR